MSEEEPVVRPAYIQKCSFWAYGESEPFGSYNHETETFTLLNEKTMGTVTWDQVLDTLNKEKADNRRVVPFPVYSSMIMMGISREAYELRERMKGSFPEERARDGEEQYGRDDYPTRWPPYTR